MEEQVSVGLITAPELPTAITKKFINDLPDIFEQKINKNISWEVEMVEDPLTGSAEHADEILDETLKIKKERGWDYAISLTDLPMFYGKYTVVADQSCPNKISSISIPAFGWLRLQSSIKRAIIQMVKELTFYSKDRNLSKEEQKRLAERWEKAFPITQVKRIKPAKNSSKAEVRYLVFPKIIGKIRLLIGMTQSNRPMSIMGSFKKVLAAAFSTGAFGLIFPTLWNLGVILSVGRLIGLMTAAIGVMAIWIIFNHHLWERPSTRNKKRLRRLYNMSTLSTLLISVITYYVLLLGFFLTATLVLIPPDVFKESVTMDGNPHIIHYLQVAWVASSISTIAGAIGAGLENEELVRDITYGYRQKRRYNGIRGQE
ncbi:5,10-methylene-tetrahydrofolate dehydrogenase [Virgibacillus kimchii]